MLNHMPVPYRLHQEDFSQALGIAAINKYEKNGQHYLKRMFDTIRKNCSDPLHDQLKLWDLCVFNFTYELDKDAVFCPQVEDD